jgi:hypothetical protein
MFIIPLLQVFNVGMYAAKATGKSYTQLNKERRIAQEQELIKYAPTSYEIGEMTHGTKQARANAADKYLTRIFNLYKFLYYNSFIHRKSIS